MLEVANRKGIRVIIPLVDNWKWMGGAAAVRRLSRQAARRLLDRSRDHRRLQADDRATSSIARTRITGVRYRDDPAIFGWETGNEIDATPEWTREIAAYISELDPNHLVVDGRSLHGVEPVASSTSRTPT